LLAYAVLLHSSIYKYFRSTCVESNVENTRVGFKLLAQNGCSVAIDKSEVGRYSLVEIVNFILIMYALLKIGEIIDNGLK
jgi:hypothetical protein